MNAILLQILFALGSGALIAGLAVGIVLTYRGSGVINLAIGGYAMLAGYAFWAFNTNQFGFTVSKWPALILALVFVMAVAALAEIIIFQPLRNQPPLAKLVASLGLLLTMQASMLLAFGTLPQAEPQVLTQKTVAMLGAVVPTNRFIIAGVVIVATVVLAAAYR